MHPSAKFLRDNADGYILHGRKKDMPMNPSTYRKFFKAAVEKIKDVRTLTPHCCRHTYISHLEDTGTDFAVIQVLAGQSERSSTIKYIHPQSPSIDTAVGKIEFLLTGKEPESCVQIGVQTDMPNTSETPHKPL